MGINPFIRNKYQLQLRLKYTIIGQIYMWILRDRTRIIISRWLSQWLSLPNTDIIWEVWLHSAKCKQMSIIYWIRLLSTEGMLIPWLKQWSRIIKCNTRNTILHGGDRIQNKRDNWVQRIHWMMGRKQMKRNRKMSFIFSELVVSNQRTLSQGL